MIYDLYTVTLWSTPMPRPISFAVHTWFVIEYQGQVDRVEVWDLTSSGSGTALCFNISPPERGCRRSVLEDPLHSTRPFISTKLADWKGTFESQAGLMYQFIKNQSIEYPFLDTYVMWPGPNSNTYTQWVLNQFPYSGLSLPWNEFGKNYT